MLGPLEYFYDFNFVEIAEKNNSTCSMSNESRFKIELDQTTNDFSLQLLSRKFDRFETV